MKTDNILWLCEDCKGRRGTEPCFIFTPAGTDHTPEKCPFADNVKAHFRSVDLKDMLKIAYDDLGVTVESGIIRKEKDDRIKVSPEEWAKMESAAISDEEQLALERAEEEKELAKVGKRKKKKEGPE